LGVREGWNTAKYWQRASDQGSNPGRLRGPRSLLSSGSRVVERIDEMCDCKDEGEFVACPTECQDMKTNVGSECTNSLSGRFILGENCPDSVWVG
jgi:hypothetical protein